MAGVRIVVVDDDEDIRQLLTLALPASSGAEVVGSADAAASAAAVVAALQPDIVVTDLVTSLAIEDSAGYLRELRRAAPAAKVVVFSGRVRREEEPLPAGVDAYVVKSGDLDELSDTIRSFGEG